MFALKLCAIKIVFGVLWNACLVSWMRKRPLSRLGLSFIMNSLIELRRPYLCSKATKRPAMLVFQTNHVGCWTLFSCKQFLLFPQICIDVSENALLYTLSWKVFTNHNIAHKRTELTRKKAGNHSFDGLLTIIKKKILQEHFELIFSELITYNSWDFLTEGLTVPCYRLLNQFLFC